MFQNNLLMAAVAAGGGGGYVIIEGSALFDSANDDQLQKTITVDGSKTKWSAHFIIKRGMFPANSDGQWYALFSASQNSNTDGDSLRITDGATAQKINLGIGGYTWNTTLKSRDLAAYFEIDVEWDSDNAEVTDRMRLYVNGTRITAWDTEGAPTSGTASRFNDSATYPYHNIGAFRYNGVSNKYKWDGYIARVAFFNNVNYDPTNYGEVTADGYWQINDISDLTPGTNGFKFEGGVDVAAGTDSYGSLDYTPSGSPTACNDSPTNDAENDFGNFSTLNPLQKNADATLSEGNLKATPEGTVQQDTMVSSTLVVPSGSKMYAEFAVTDSTTGMVGVQKANEWGADFDVMAADSMRILHIATGDIYSSDGVIEDSNYAPNDTVPVTLMVAVDLENDNMYIGDASTDKWSDGSGAYDQDWSGSPGAISLPANLNWKFVLKLYNATQVVNFGATAFTGTKPTGYSTLATQNMPTPTIPDPTEHHQVELVSHDGSSTAFTCNWDADTYDTLFIIKNRDNTEAWYLVDGLNGYNKYTQIQTTTQQTDANVISVSGTTCTLGSTLASAAYLVECHKAGLSASRATNSGGTNTTTTSYNSTSKFVIGTYPTGASPSGGDTIEHGMAAAPEFMHFHKLGADGTVVVWHKNAGGNTGGMGLDNDGGFDVSANYWNDTSPDATTVTLGASTAHNAASENFVFYGWIGVEGYSEFTSFIGPGASEPFPMVNLGFSPGSFWWKTANKVEEWYSLQKVIQDYNPKSEYLIISATDAETTLIQWDFLSNGARERATGGHMGQPGKITLVMTWGGTPIQGPAPSTSTSQGRAR